MFCVAPDCDRTHYATGYCKLHYERLRRYDALEKPNKIFKGYCEIEGCNNEIAITKWCRKHYDQQRHFKLNKEILAKFDRAHHIKYRYGITIEQYNDLLKKQNNKCAICDKEETRIISGKIRDLSVDHNHVTNKVRELLCYKCNWALGVLEDNIEILEAMKNYLIKHR